MNKSVCVCVAVAGAQFGASEPPEVPQRAAGARAGVAEREPLPAGTAQQNQTGTPQRHPQGKNSTCTTTAQALLPH